MISSKVLELESVHVDPITNEPRRRIEAQRLDLENAVLVQELMAVKEEKVTPICFRHFSLQVL